ncbi:cupin domain-containing protein [Streptomyces sp. NPDC059740]|uniref:cupin domain-containing protein n=1 Tax=Streptomyces sp. NPDC059740 TaxID=3346926 RepID=UPI003657A309
MRTLDPEAIAAHYGLQPLSRHGGRFRRTWEGPARPDGRPEGSALIDLLTAAPEDVVALHRLPQDEVWHHYLGDPLALLLLHAEGGVTTPVLGPDVLGGQQVQLTVPAGTWRGALVADGGAWTLFGRTAAPGFSFEDYQAAHRDDLATRYPHEAQLIARLTRSDQGGEEAGGI